MRVPAILFLTSAQRVAVLQQRGSVAACAYRRLFCCICNWYSPLKIIFWLFYWYWLFGKVFTLAIRDERAQRILVWIYHIFHGLGTINNWMLPKWNWIGIVCYVILHRMASLKASWNVNVVVYSDFDSRYLLYFLRRQKAFFF